MFAEFPDSREYRLQSDVSEGYNFQELPSGKIKVRFMYGPRVSMAAIGELSRRRGMMLSVSLDGAEPFNLVGCHLLDPKNSQPQDRYDFARFFSEAIRELETRINNNRTIVIGDFNMNPFESGMISVNNLNAVMDRGIARGKHRTHGNNKYPFFFNPMWFFMGHPIHMNGTIYYRSSSVDLYYWNLYDQVLIRPSLIDGFNHDDLKIITEAGTTSLLTNRKLIRKEISDHLPLLISLKL